MEASRVRSAWVRAASPASMPAAVRSSWARSSCSIQRSRASSSRYCWSTMPCHTAPSTRSVPAGADIPTAALWVSYTAPYCTLPGGICIHRMSSSAPPVPAVARPSSGAWYSTRRPRPMPRAKASSRGLGAASANPFCQGSACHPQAPSAGTPWAPCSGRYSSRSSMRRSTQPCSGRPVSVWAGPSAGPRSSVPDSSRPRKCQWPAWAASTANRSSSPCTTSHRTSGPSSDRLRRPVQSTGVPRAPRAATTGSGAMWAWWGS